MTQKAAAVRLNYTSTEVRLDGATLSAVRVTTSHDRDFSAVVAAHGLLRHMHAPQNRSTKPDPAVSLGNHVMAVCAEYVVRDFHGLPVPQDWVSYQAERALGGFDIPELRAGVKGRWLSSGRVDLGVSATDHGPQILVLARDQLDKLLIMGWETAEVVRERGVRVPSGGGINGTQPRWYERPVSLQPHDSLPDPGKAHDNG